MRKLRDESGQSMVEFALVVPILLTVLLAIASFASVWERKASLNDGVRAEARRASVCRFSPINPSPQDAFSQTVGSDLPGVTVPNPSYASGSCSAGTQVTVTGTYPWSISILGISFGSGTLTTTSVGVVE